MMAWVAQTLPPFLNNIFILSTLSITERTRRVTNPQILFSLIKQRKVEQSKVVEEDGQGLFPTTVTVSGEG